MDKQLWRTALLIAVLSLPDWVAAQSLTWRPIQRFDSVRIEQIAFSDTAYGWILGQTTLDATYQSHAVLNRTTDWGQTWVRQPFVVDGVPTDQLWDGASERLIVLSKKDLLLSCSRRLPLLWSGDGGLTWQKRDTAKQAISFFQFWDTVHGVGLGSSRQLVRSDDGGWTFRPIMDFPGDSLFNTAFSFNAYNQLLCLNGRDWLIPNQTAGDTVIRILVSRDSGESWALDSLPASEEVSKSIGCSLWMGADSSSVWLVPFLRGPGLGGTKHSLFRSADRGASFVPVDSSLGLRHGTFWPVSNSVLLFAGSTSDTNNSGQTDRVYRSTDGGRSWVGDSSTFRGWVVAGFGSSGEPFEWVFADSLRNAKSGDYSSELYRWESNSSVDDGQTASQLMLSAFPNPTTGLVTITSDFGAAISYAGTFDATGRDMRCDCTATSLGSLQLDLSALPSNIYYVLIYTVSRPYLVPIVCFR